MKLQSIEILIYPVSSKGCDMDFSKLEVELANEFKITPLQARGFIDAFECVDRFSFVKNKDELNQLCVETVGVKEKKRHYTYTDIPLVIKQTVEKFLDKGKSVGSFYCLLKMEKNIKIFIKECIKNKIQPKAFYIDGILTYQELKREPKTDLTTQVVIFK